jgi:adenylylsulfate kinase-like enzyme
VIWLIELSGSGKTTYGRAIWKQLRADSNHVVGLDIPFKAPAGSDFRINNRIDGLSANAMATKVLREARGQPAGRSLVGEPALF